jgi:transposase-like protein
VSRPSFPANFREFLAWFPDEEACLDYLVRSRWPDGFVCPHCGHAGGWEIKARVRSRAAGATDKTPRMPKRLWQCPACDKQTSATSGTVMDHTRMSLTTWFHAAFLMAADKRGISALGLDAQLDLGNHKTAWFLLHKFRRAMVNANRSRLHGTVEMDGSYVGGYQPGLKGGRQRKGRKAALILVAVEVLTRTKKGQDGVERTVEYAGRARIEVVRGENAMVIGDFLERNVEPGSTIRSDGLAAYGLACRELGYASLMRTQGKATREQQVVPIAHRLISNLKVWLNGTHHGVGRPHLQAYLDEFVFRLNRRASPEAAFQTLLGLGAQHAPVRRRTIIRASDLPYYYEGDEVEDEAIA